MNTDQIIKLEERTLKDLYEWSIKKREIDKLKKASEIVEKDMFDILFSLAVPIYDIIKRKDMVNLKEIIEQHQFVELIESSKKALESVNRDFVENMADRVRSFERDVMRVADLYGVPDYRNIEDLANIEEKLKYDRKPLPSLLIVLMWNSRVLHNRLSSRAVWLSYKKP